MTGRRRSLFSKIYNLGERVNAMRGRNSNYVTLVSIPNTNLHRQLEIRHQLQKPAHMYGARGGSARLVTHPVSIPPRVSDLSASWYKGSPLR